MKMRLSHKLWIHIWVRHPLADKFNWPRGFWHGNGASGFSLGKFNLMITYPANRR